MKSLPLLFLVWEIVNAAAVILPNSPKHEILQARDSEGSNEDAAPSATICGEIIDYVNNGTFVFYASAAYDCLRSVPFNDAVALRFIDYYNTTMQFQTTVSLLRDPPEGYQQPAFDLQQGLANLRDNVTANVYKNQYAFEADLQYLVYQVHDTHVDLSAGVLASFTFGSPYSILSASIDGKQEPQVWFRDEITAYVENPDSTAPSPIVSINGEDVVDYLTRFAALNSQGTLEPHGDWNQLMDSPAMDIQSSVSAFAGAATFYPGDELNFTRADGTQESTRWLAFYNEPYFTGPLTTGGDFYNYFVLGLLPASYDSIPLPEVFNFTDQWYDLDSDSSMTNWSSITSAYPDDPIVVQEGLYVASSKILTGYLLPDISVGVLSLPTFSEFDDDIQPFAAAIQQFLGNATSQGIQKIIIDVQQNWGGDVLLAFTTFRQFFPLAEPFAGSHKRSHYLADVLGKTFTEFWDGLSLEDDGDADIKSQLEGTEWVVTPRINAETGSNFTSWEQYAGPITYRNDNFSLTERYNLSNTLFDQSAFDGWIPTDYVDPPTENGPYNSSDIIILTDGLCASTCTLFVEMMSQAGVRTVAVGGRPEAGPMQASSGTRGAVTYSAAELDNDFFNASGILSINGTVNAASEALVPLNTARNSGMWVNRAGITLRDQVMSVDDSEPLQLKYQAADCRLYWTLENVLNFTRLWSDAATAIWDDPSLCVTGSTGYTTKGVDSATQKAPPSRLFSTAPPLPAAPGVDFDASSEGLSDANGGDVSYISQTSQKCSTTKNDSCDFASTGLECRPAKKGASTGYCVSSCVSTDKYCIVGDQSCRLFKTNLDAQSNSQTGLYSPSKYSTSVKMGTCWPRESH